MIVNKHPRINIKGFILEKLSDACPEQYDVFKNKKQVGYIRLRGGNLRVSFPDVGGKEILKIEFDNPYKGQFDTSDERKYYQILAIDLIKQYTKKYKG